TIRRRRESYYQLGKMPVLWPVHLSLPRWCVRSGNQGLSDTGGRQTGPPAAVGPGTRRYLFQRRSAPNRGSLSRSLSDTLRRKGTLWSDPKPNGPGGSGVRSKTAKIG